MRYLVIVDSSSFVGQSLIGADAEVSPEGHAVLDCKSCETDHHYFLKVVRGPLGKDGKHQSLYIPYHAVLAVNEYAKGEEKGFGFLAS